MKDTTRRNLWGLFALLVMGMIFAFSADTAVASNAKSSFLCDVLYPLFASLFSLDTFTFLIRKAAHFSIYALLGICVCNACLADARLRRRAIWIAVGVCFLYACSDELHQLFSDGRSGQFRDVLLDTAGALCGSLLTAQIHRFNHRPPR